MLIKCWSWKFEFQVIRGKLPYLVVPSKNDMAKNDTKQREKCKSEFLAILLCRALQTFEISRRLWAKELEVAVSSNWWLISFLTGFPPSANVALGARLSVESVDSLYFKSCTYIHRVIREHHVSAESTKEIFRFDQLTQRQRSNATRPSAVR